MSASSAPPLVTNVPRRVSPASAPPVEHPPGGGITASQSTGAVNRSASTARKRASAPPTNKASTWTGSHPHPQSSSHTHARAALSNGQPGQPSLMSIVEGVTRANRDGWAAHTREVDLSPASSPGASPGGGGLVGVSVFLLYLFTQGLHGDRFRQQRILRKVAESGSSHGTKSQDTYYMLLCFLSQRLKGSVWPESEHFLQIPPSCRPQIT